MSPAQVATDSQGVEGAGEGDSSDKAAIQWQ
jgi:hypothetical protein